jgi:glycosyltransferase involved in cell wall biosynthesis
MNILFFSDYFPPEVCAPATRTYAHCKKFVELGHSVTVITSFPNFPNGKVYNGYKNRFYSLEYVEGIKLIRIMTFIYKNEGHLLRTIDHLSYAINSILISFFLKNKYDVVIATSPQFFTLFSGFFYSKIFKVKFLIEVRDLWPEGIIFLNRESLMYKLLEKMEKYLYRKASGIVVVTNSFKKEIIQRVGIKEEKIEVVFNGTDSFFCETEHLEIKQISKLKQNKFIIGYAGTIGQSHGFEFLMKEFEYFNEKFPQFHFIIIGSGYFENTLKEFILSHNLSNITVLGMMSKIDVKSYISIFNVGLVVLKDFAPYRKVIPSKLFELAELNVPILLGVKGESMDLVSEYGVGKIFSPENSEEFRSQLLDFYNEKLNKVLPIKYDFGLKRMTKDFSRASQALKMERFIYKTYKND